MIEISIYITLKCIHIINGNNRRKIRITCPKFGYKISRHYFIPVTCVGMPYIEGYDNN